MLNKMKATEPGSGGILNGEWRDTYLKKNKY